MNDQDVEILKKRFVEKLSLSQIADGMCLTKQRIHQRLNTIYKYLMIDSFRIEWIKTNHLDSVEDDVLGLIFSVDNATRNKLIRLIRERDIESVKDILKLRPKDFHTIHSIGRKGVLDIKLALLNWGTPYDAETKESIEEKILAYKSKSDYGLQLRFKILERDGFKCQYCGRSPRENKKIILHVDHIKPLVKGGLWTESNLITACQECNIGKKDTILSERNQRRMSTH